MAMRASGLIIRGHVLSILPWHGSDGDGSVRVLGWRSGNGKPISNEWFNRSESVVDICAKGFVSRLVESWIGRQLQPKILTRTGSKRYRSIEWDIQTGPVTNKLTARGVVAFIVKVILLKFNGEMLMPAATTFDVNRKIITVLVLNTVQT